MEQLALFGVGQIVGTGQPRPWPTADTEPEPEPAPHDANQLAFTEEDAP